MKSLVEISIQVLHSCGTRSGAPTTRDALCIKRRTEAEGDSFLTITLPAFSASFDRCLSNGFLDPFLFQGFKFLKKKCLPRFLSGFTSRIFSPDGKILDEPSIDCIRSVRQTCLLHKKVELPCTRARLLKAEKRFIECENELKDHVYDPIDLLYFEKTSRIVLADIFRNVPYGYITDRLKPKHGPGVTSEGFRGNRKFRDTTWYRRLDRSFSYTDFGIGSISNYIRDSRPVSDDKLIEPRYEQPSRVCFVPKTLKTPRVIAAEPACMQFMQQAILRELVPLIENGRYTSGRLNFKQQDVNAQIALSSSKSGRFATIDLSEASDRVSSKIVWLMLSVLPDFRRAVFDCRTSRSKLPSGAQCFLRKFASMGSALCFPIEALTFFNVIVSKRIRRANLPVTPSSVRLYSRGLYIYGDDIIVPSDEAPVVSNDLLDFCLKINVAKSFWTGKFRESCGVDAFDGEDVTPTYLRHLPPRDKTDANGIVSYVAFINHLYKGGLWKCVKVLRDSLELMLGKIPFADDTFQGVAWNSYSNATSHSRWNKHLHRPEMSALMPFPKRQNDQLNDDSALLKCFGVIGLETYDSEHLLTTVRFGNLALKRRWVAG